MKKIFWLQFFIPFLLLAQTEFSQDNATALLKVLSVDIGPRPMGSPAEQQALQFAVERFKEYGCDTAYITKFDRTSKVNTNSGVAVGINYGATKRSICIGGHIDSSEPEVPGADDDGSGSAIVMELARVFGKREMQSTLIFCCFGGEEQGLIGSNYFVNHFEDIDSIVLMLQIDMANGLGIIELDPETHGAMAPQWLVSAALEEFYTLGYSGLRYPTHFFSLNYAFPGGPGSDHEPFLQKGIPAIDFSTDISKPIHTARDNFENFDPRGLKRSGDLVTKLVERFDGGVPSRTTEEYWLYTLGSTAIFLPLGVLWGIIVFSSVIALIALVIVRRRSQPPERTALPEQTDTITSPPKVKWSGIKTFLFVVIIISCGWLSLDVMSLLKGVRFPWFAEIPLYYGYGLFASFVGVWLSATLARTLKLSQDPFPFFVRAFIILGIFVVLASLLSPKVALYPSLALLLISLAMMLRWTALRGILCVLALAVMVRFIFPEWDELFMRVGASSLTSSDALLWMRRSVMLSLVYSVYLLPLAYAVLAVVRDTPSLKNAGVFFASKKYIVITAVLFIGWTAYLLPRPSYNSLWYREVEATQEINLDSAKATITLQSPEYLNGLRIRHADAETTITSHTTSVSITPRREIDTLLRDDYDIVIGTSSWVKIFHSISTEQRGDTTLFDTHLQLQMQFRPFTVSVSYTGKDSSFLDFDTRLQYRSTKSTKKIEWYSFPDSILDIPVKFSIVGNDSVREEIIVTFNKLAYPMEFERELTTIIPRTIYTSTHLYKK